MSASFKILPAVRNAYAFAGRNFAVLARASVPPVVLHVGTMFFLQTYRPDASPVEAFLWSLPSNVAFAWLMFVEARLLLLGEPIGAPPQDPAQLLDRRRLMNAAVTVFLLFDMATTAIGACLQWALKTRSFETSPVVTFSIIALLGVFLWSLRFSVVHILVAVGAPVRPFLARVRGMGFSFRLLAMGALCTLPVYIILEFMMGALMTAPAAGEKLSQGQVSAVILLSAPAAAALPLLLNAAAVFALKDLLGRRGGA